MLIAAKTVTVTTADGLAELNAYLHDQWMNVDEIRAQTGRLVVPMLLREDEPFHWSGNWFRRRYGYHRRRATLYINNVLDYQIQDAARIGGTSVNEITMVGKTVIIQGCPPASVKAEVSSVSLILDITDEIADDVVEWAYFGGRIWSRA